MTGEIPRNKILVGHALEVLRTLPDGCVQTCITSPPYWGLRKYGDYEAVWGGDSSHAHVFTESRFCACGAWRGQLGLEPTPFEYVEHIVDVMREVRRVLRDDGVLWINLGDCYTAAPGGDVGTKSSLEGSGTGMTESKLASRGAGPRLGHRSSFRRDRMPRQDHAHKSVPTLKAKDLVGIPWRVAFALQEDGWWLRMDNIWAKRNCIPESTRDRTTKSHEYIFHLAKSERYFYDQDAIREPVAFPEESTAEDLARAMSRKRETVVDPYQEPAKAYGSGNKERFVAGENGDRDRLKTHLGSSVPWKYDGTGRNKRSVWSFSTEQFTGDLCGRCGRYYEDNPKTCKCGAGDAWISHYAAFPEELVRTCMLAATSEHGSCAECGAPWLRLSEGGRTTGWKASCGHRSRGGVSPCVVLDPFMGTGTTAMVAAKGSRDFIGIEINPAYVSMATEQLRPEVEQARLL